MITDRELIVSLNQSLAVAAGTTASTDSIDLTTGADISRGGVPIRARSQVTVAFAGGTSVQAQLVESDSSNLSSPTVLYSGPVLADAAALAGAILADVTIPRTAKRYIGFQYVTLGVHTAGQVTSEFVLDTETPLADRRVGYTGLVPGA